ncbi:hypothetical protein FQN60_018055, partial [Etheostoma spectabile]
MSTPVESDKRDRGGVGLHNEFSSMEAGCGRDEQDYSNALMQRARQIDSYPVISFPANLTLTECSRFSLQPIQRHLCMPLLPAGLMIVMLYFLTHLLLYTEQRFLTHSI